MKKILLIASVAFLGTTAMAQTQVQQGNFIIDPYIGAPNWANSLLYKDLDGDNIGWQDYKLNGGLLSYGGRVEYLLADDFGVGVDVNYEVSGYNYNETVSVWDPGTSQYIDAKYATDYKSKKFRVMARLTYHFVQNDRVDAYTAFSGGYKNVNRLWTSENPNSIEDEELEGALIPISFRLAAGARVYFIENLGIHMELGAFGGSLLQFGLSAKF